MLVRSAVRVNECWETRERALRRMFWRRVDGAEGGMVDVLWYRV